jgi:hypothetical protein
MDQSGKASQAADVVSVWSGLKTLLSLNHCSAVRGLLRYKQTNKTGRLTTTKVRRSRGLAAAPRISARGYS